MRTVRKHLFLVALTPLFVLGMAGSANASTSGTIKVPAKYASGLTVGVDTTYPPDEFVKSGKIVGFDIDLAAALSKVMGVKWEIKTASFDTIIPGLIDGRFDVGNSSFTDNKAREKQVTFVDYFKAGEGFYESATSTHVFNGLESLCGHSVSVESGTVEQTDAQTQSKHCKVNVESFENQNEANLAVSDGHADLGFADSQVAAYIVHTSGGQFKLTGTPFSVTPYGFIVPKASGLAQPLLAAVKAIMANGEYKKILDSWGVEQGAISTPTINGATS
ncbi:MAG TPA: ABC transporter substrate-binding protein [Acidimicrobiales bacterium]|nr:ABC transporter substrate-binding protein [Acidimicrobiales bacterium]